MGEGTVRELGRHMYTALYLRRMTNENLLDSTGTLLHVNWLPGWKGCLGENGYMHMYG